jgi:hypothetical protein
MKFSTDDDINDEMDDDDDDQYAHGKHRSTAEQVFETVHKISDENDHNVDETSLVCHKGDRK